MRVKPVMYVNKQVLLLNKNVKNLKKEFVSLHDKILYELERESQKTKAKDKVVSKDDVKELKKELTYYKNEVNRKKSVVKEIKGHMDNSFKFMMNSISNLKEEQENYQKTTTKAIELSKKRIKRLYREFG